LKKHHLPFAHLKPFDAPIGLMGHFLHFVCGNHHNGLSIQGIMLRLFPFQKLFQPIQRRPPNLCLNERRPSQQNPHRPQRHPAPPPEVKLVGVFDDQAVLEEKRRFDDVMYFSASFAKTVPGFPMGGSRPVVGLYTVKGDFEISRSPAQHCPHGAGPCPLQPPKRRVSEHDVGVVARAHAHRIEGLETCIEGLDELGMGVHGASFEMNKHAVDNDFISHSLKPVVVFKGFHPLA
jgi:hypothetical protein